MVLMKVDVGRRVDVDEMHNNVVENRHSMEDDRKSLQMIDNPFFINQQIRIRSRGNLPSGG